MHKMIKPISVVHVIGAMNRGGAETFVMNVFRNIDRDKYKFYFLCYGDKNFDYENEINSLGGKILRIPDVKEVGVLQHIKDITRVIKENEIDVVHAHTYYNAVFSLISAKLSGVKTRIAHSHNTFSETNPSLAKKAYFLISKMIIDMFTNVRLACGNAAGKAYFMPWRTYSVVQNGIELEKFKFNKRDRLAVRGELGIDEEDLVILNVARFEEVKNHTFLVDVFKSVHDKCNKTKLLLVGDGSLRNDIEKKAISLGLRNSIIFTGLRSDVARILSAADVLVMPSLFEGLPVSLIEAQANGLKCYISDTIDNNVKVSDLIEFISLDKNADSWGKAILDGRKSYNRGETYIIDPSYDIGNSVEKMENIYLEK